jgi:hypothetical protein
MRNLCYTKGKLHIFWYILSHLTHTIQPISCFNVKRYSSCEGHHLYSTKTILLNLSSLHVVKIFHTFCACRWMNWFAELKAEVIGHRRWGLQHSLKAFCLLKRRKVTSLKPCLNFLCLQDFVTLVTNSDYCTINRDFFRKFLHLLFYVGLPSKCHKQILFFLFLI